MSVARALQADASNPDGQPDAYDGFGLDGIDGFDGEVVDDLQMALNQIPPAGWEVSDGSHGDTSVAMPLMEVGCTPRQADALPSFPTRVAGSTSLEI